jgi:hypothetical protein
VRIRNHIPYLGQRFALFYLFSVRLDARSHELSA